MGQTLTPRQRRARDGVLLASEVAAHLGISTKGFYGRRARGTFDLEPTPWHGDDRDVWSIEAVDAWLESHQIVRYRKSADH